MDRSTWLITGASSGLGYALAEYVLEQGDQVVAAARTIEPMAALTERYPDAGLALTLDVTDPQQRADAISQAEARFGAIDILVNNAGIDFIGAIEEQEEKDYRAQFEVNFFAAAALLRQVLPGMRARGRGTIINISSMDGVASLPVNGWYASSKFAPEGSQKRSGNGPRSSHHQLATGRGRWSLVSVLRRRVPCSVALGLDLARLSAGGHRRLGLE